MGHYLLIASLLSLREFEMMDRVVRILFGWASIFQRTRTWILTPICFLDPL